MLFFIKVKPINACFACNLLTKSSHSMPYNTRTASPQAQPKRRIRRFMYTRFHIAWKYSTIDYDSILHTAEYLAPELRSPRTDGCLETTASATAHRQRPGTAHAHSTTCRPQQGTCLREISQPAPNVKPYGHSLSAQTANTDSTQLAAVRCDITAQLGCVVRVHSSRDAGDRRLGRGVSLGVFMTFF